MKRLIIISILSLIIVPAICQVPVPTGLKAKLIQTDSMNLVQLSWSKKSNKDSVTVGYNLLTNFPPHEELMISQKAGVVYDTSYLYPISNVRGAKYRFALMGLKNFPKVERSEVSDVVEILVPSTVIPHVQLNKVKQDAGKLIVNWGYPNDIADLSGFKIFLNDELLTEIPPDKRVVEYEGGETGTYIFQVRAYTNNIESKPSQKRLIKVEN
ncbi:MAG: hypothetical protein ABJH05_12475 [Fulvivirga sp.]